MTTRVVRTVVLSVIAFALATGVLLPSAVQAAAHLDTGTHRPHFFKSRYVDAGQAASTNNLSYNGGPVMNGTMRAYLIFWEPSGSQVSDTYNSLLQRYFGDVGGSGLYQNNTQYTDSSGGAPNNAALAGTWVDTTPYPSSSLQDANIQNEVTNALNTNGWTPNISTMFFVFTAKGENICDSGSCSFSQFCAYHNYFGTNTIYAAMPYDGTDLQGCGPLPKGSPNGDTDADAEISTASHEQMEAATDPLITAWIDSRGQEIGDKCAYNYGQTSSDGSNANWNNHPYIVQQEWDNARSGCALVGP
jgi:hypothetical protein